MIIFNILKKVFILIIMTVLCTQIVFAETGENFVAENYAMSKAPQLQACYADSSGYDFMTGEVRYSNNLIVGALPYSFHYRAPLRQNISVAQLFYQPEISSLGWNDNYRSHVIVQNVTRQTKRYQYKYSEIKNIFGQPETGAVLAESYNPVMSTDTIRTLRVLLPGDSAEVVFLEENGVFKRVNSADPVGRITTGFVFDAWDLEQANKADNMGEYQIQRSGSNLIISKNGTQYLISGSSYTMSGIQTATRTQSAYVTNDLKWGVTWDKWSLENRPYYARSNTTPYLETTMSVSMSLQRVTKIDDKKGNIINLQYDNKMNLIQVSDRYNNKLVLERAFHDPSQGASQTVNESRLVTKVTYTAAQGGVQTATFSYKGYLVKSPTTGQNITVFALTGTTSTKAGNYTFTNTLKDLAGVKLYVARSERTPDASYNLPVLTRVQNSAWQVIREWNISQNYIVNGVGVNANFNIATTSIRSWTPNASSQVSLVMQLTYDDTRKSIGQAVYLDNIKKAVTYFSTLPYGEVQISGAPCLTINGKPVSKIYFDTTKGLIKEFKNAGGIHSYYLYDSQNRVIQFDDGSSARRTTYTYGPLSNNTTNIFLTPTKIVTPIMTITNVVNPRGQVVTQTQTSNQAGSTSKVTSYSYDESLTSKHYGRVLAVDGPRSGVTDKVVYAYDAFGNLASQSRTVNGIARATQYLNYNTFANPERIMMPNGMVNQFNYNADGTLASEIIGTGGTTGAVTGQTTAYTYNTLKQRITETKPDGDVTKFTYDQLGYLKESILPNGNIVQMGYHPTGALASEKLLTPARVVAAETYQFLDDNGRIAKIQKGSDANRLYTLFAYDPNGNLIKTTSATGVINTWEYDSLDRVVSHTDGMGNTNTKAYDLNDNVISIKDALNAGSNPYVYRNGSTLTQEVNSDYGTKTYSYNEADELIQHLHGSRKCNYNNLDEIGRYRAYVCAANSGSTANEYQVNDNYVYDQSRYGRLDRVTSNIAGLDVNTSYTYDAYDRITKKSQVNLLANRWLNTANQSLNVSYAYSTGGKLNSVTLPSGRTIAYSYNLAAGTLTGINLNNSALIRGITYDGANRITGWSWGATGTSGYGLTYDSSGLLSSIVNKNNSAVNYSLTYGYDTDGRITSITRNNGIKDNLAYDALDHLTSETRLNGSTTVYSIAYTYDKNGNRTSLKATGAHAQPSANVTYNYSGNKLTGLTKGGVAQTLTYTGNAELAFGAYKAAYDNGGRRKADHGTNHYYYMNYNYKNERNTRGYVTNNAASGVIQYVYDEESHLIGEYSGATPIVEYVWLGDKPIAAIYGSGTATKIYYIVTDHLNTPRRLVDSSNQAIVWSWDSTAFGLGNPTGSITFNLRFPGQYYDVGTGQFYNHNRFYNPELGRYMEPDPIGLEGGLNPYAYAGSNPVMNGDPSGLDFKEIPNLSATWLENTYNYILAIPPGITANYDWSRPTYGNMSISNQQRNNFNTTKDYKALYVDRWETNHDPVARTSAIGWQRTTPSMNVQPWENAAAAVTWGSMEAYLHIQGYSSGNGSLKSKMNAIGISVATEYIKAVDADKSGIPGLLNPIQVQQYHYAAFKQQGVPKQIFGGNFGGMLGANSYSFLWCRYCDK